MAEGGSPDGCDRCGSAAHTVAFVDETCRGSVYGLAAVLVCRCQLDTVRRTVRGLVRPGQRRVHFAKEQDRNRKAFLSTIGRTPITAVFVTAAARGAEARSACWHQLVPDLVSVGVRQLTIERVDGAEGRDRRDIRAALLGKGMLGELGYRHECPAAEPMLWVADAIAWAAGAGGPWSARIRPVLRRS